MADGSRIDKTLTIALSDLRVRRPLHVPTAPDLHLLHLRPVSVVELSARATVLEVDSTLSFSLLQMLFNHDFQKLGCKIRSTSSFYTERVFTVHEEKCTIKGRVRLKDSSHESRHDSISIPPCSAIAPKLYWFGCCLDLTKLALASLSLSDAWK